MGVWWVMSGWLVGVEWVVSGWLVGVECVDDHYILQVLTMVIFALIVGLIYLRLDDKDVNVRTVISDRYTHTHTHTHYIAT